MINFCFVYRVSYLFSKTQFWPFAIVEVSREVGNLIQENNELLATK